MGHAHNSRHARRRTPAIAAGLALVTALLAGCSGEQPVQSLKVGDCFDDTVELLGAIEVFTVPSVRCDMPHDSGDTYSQPSIEDFAEIVCFAAFEPYVGRSYDTSVLDFTWLIPTEVAWSRGERDIRCVLYHYDLQQLRRSARGSGL